MSFTLGAKEKLRGTVTRLIDVFGYESAALEDRIGYGRGRLARGYYLALLAEPFAPGDFEFMGYTYFSGGKLGLPSNDRTVEAARPRVQDLLAIEHGQQAVQEIKAEFCKNILLKGAERVAKILPIIRHSDAMGAADQYPRGRGIAQPIQLLEGHEKWFLIAAEVHGTVWQLAPDARLANFKSPIDLASRPRYDRPYSQDARKQVLDYLSVARQT